MINNAGKAS